MAGFGDAFRNARANRGSTLSEVERVLRIPRKYLRAIEDEDFTVLPEGIYSRGIVRNYAQYLNLDPEDAIAYFEDLRGATPGGIKVVPAVKPLEVPSHWAPNFALIAFMMVISAIIFAWLYSALFASRDAVATPTAAISTPTVIDTTPALLALTPTAAARSDAAAATVPEPLSTQAPIPVPEPPRTQPPAPVFVTPAPVVAPAVPPTAPPTSAPVAPTVAPPPPTATTPPAPTTYIVTVRSTATAWVSVTVDGTIEFSADLEPGKTLTFTGSTITILSANATKVRFAVDGVDRGLLSTTTWRAEVTVP